VGVGGAVGKQKETEMLNDELKPQLEDKSEM
jgi:hypothetical protein